MANSMTIPITDDAHFAQIAMELLSSLCGDIPSEELVKANLGVGRLVLVEVALDEMIETCSNLIVDLVVTDEDLRIEMLKLVHQDSQLREQFKKGAWRIYNEWTCAA